MRVLHAGVIPGCGNIAPRAAVLYNGVLAGIGNAKNSDTVCVPEGLLNISMNEPADLASPPPVSEKGIRMSLWSWKCGTPTRSLPALLAVLLAATGLGCRPKTHGTTAETPVAPVSHPVQRVVTDYVYFTGRCQAVQSVNIVPRVTGYLSKPFFKEGSEVKEGEPVVRDRSAAVPSAV